MNERIDELDKAAQEYAGRICGNDEDSNYNEWFNVYKEKFAELIVRECTDIAINAASDTNFITGISEADRRALSIAVEIKQHFGVEE